MDFEYSENGPFRDDACDGLYKALCSWVNLKKITLKFTKLVFITEKGANILAKGYKNLN